MDKSIMEFQGPLSNPKRNKRLFTIGDNANKCGSHNQTNLVLPVHSVFLIFSCSLWISSHERNWHKKKAEQFCKYSILYHMRGYFKGTRENKKHIIQDVRSHAVVTNYCVESNAHYDNQNFSSLSNWVYLIAPFSVMWTSPILNPKWE